MRCLLLLPWTAVITATLGGCHIDVTRVRSGKPLDREAYTELEPQKTSRGEALQRLGAPDSVEWKSGKDYLSYIHEDFTQVGIRFQLPFSFFGYRHTVAELEGSADDANTMSLIFDERGILEQKSLRLSEAYTQLETEEEAGWAFYVLPQFNYSPVFFGDGGERDYEDLFKDGYMAGLHLGLLPAPFFMILVGGNYQEYRGDDFTKRGNRFSLDDLEIVQAEVGGRLQVPPEAFTSFWNMEELKALLYSADVHRHQGPFVYLKWTISGTYNEDLRVKRNGQSRGTYFDRSVRLSSSVGGGFEYRRGPFGFHLEALYQVIGAFKEGSTPLDTDADDFQNLLFGGGVSVRF